MAEFMELCHHPIITWIKPYAIFPASYAQECDGGWSLVGEYVCKPFVGLWDKRERNENTGWGSSGRWRRQTHPTAVYRKQSITHSNHSVKLCSEGPPNWFVGFACFLGNFCIIAGWEAKTKMISLAMTTVFSEMDLSYSNHFWNGPLLFPCNVTFYNISSMKHLNKSILS